MTALKTIWKLPLISAALALSAAHLRAAQATAATDSVYLSLQDSLNQASANLEQIEASINGVEERTTLAWSSVREIEARRQAGKTVRQDSLELASLLDVAETLEQHLQHEAEAIAAIEQTLRFVQVSSYRLGYLDLHRAANSALDVLADVSSDADSSIAACVDLQNEIERVMSLLKP